ncbi:MAG TPA: MBL fold metallo-hydrolase [Planctomycetota bacterium]|nr:MBL fold metallo-hydrolase [Planctomycetota bacterium]
MQVSPVDLYVAIEGGRRPSILDVRNAEDHARWKVDGPGRFDSLNIPYFAFIEDEAASISKVKAWKAALPGDLTVVCAKGDSSAFVAEILRASGLPAANLEGGMAAWGAASVRKLLVSGPATRVWQVLRFGKGCLSYLVAAGNDALVIDPHRHVEEYRKALADLGLNLRGVFDTHLHADHLSGAHALAEAEGVPYFAHPLDFAGAAFEFSAVRDGQALALGEINVVPVSFLHAPGHTPGSTLLLVNNAFLLTGDTLFVGHIGRPDLGGRAREWAHDLFKSLTVRLAKLDGALRALPAHTSGTAEFRADGTVVETLDVLRHRIAFLRMSEVDFVQAVVDGVAPAPAAYAAIRLLNLGVTEASEDVRLEMELGRNECALARR